MPSILIVDDEKDIRTIIRRYAELENYDITEASDGMEAISLCRERDFDVMVMDVMMPGMDGFTACREIRKAKDIPALMLSARGSEADKLYGFELGIDDYVVKPFSPRELMARLKVILARHASNAKPAADVLAFGRLKIDRAGHAVEVDGASVPMTAKEYALLLYLAENRGIALTREQILRAVWGYDYVGEDRTADWQIKMLRSKLGACREYILTIRGVGYKFEVA